MSRTLGFYFFMIEGPSESPYHLFQPFGLRNAFFAAWPPAAEWLFFFLLAGMPPAGPLLDAQKARFFRGVPRPGGPTFGRPKVGGKSASPLRAGPPLFCLIGLGLICCTAADEFPLGRRPPRNRCGASRTSPDGPRAGGRCSRGSPAQAALSAACGGIHLAPRTRVTFVRTKSHQKGARVPLDPFFAQSVGIREDTGQPLNLL